MRALLRPRCPGANPMTREEAYEWLIDHGIGTISYLEPVKAGEALVALVNETRNAALEEAANAAELGACARPKQMVSACEHGRCELKRAAGDRVRALLSDPAVRP